MFKSRSYVGLVNIKEIDNLFNEASQKKPQQTDKNLISKHTQKVNLAKMLLPSVAAILIALLVIFPSLQNNDRSFLLDITLPKKGELEKLHVEQITLNITDGKNRVNNFTSDNIDETTPGSKLIKLKNPDGVLPTSDIDWINVKSPTGFYDQKANTLRLIDNVEIYYSQGMNVNVPDILYDFKTNIAKSDKSVKAQGELGHLTSEAFEMNTETGIVIFKGKTFIKLREDSLKGME